LLGFPEGDALGNPGLPQRVPEDAHRDNPAPLSPAHECPRTLDPLPHRIGFTTFGQPNGLMGYCQILGRTWGGGLRAPSLLLRFGSQAIEERGRTPVR
jgi:hypothetical protein